MSYTMRAAHEGDTYQVYALLNREDVFMWSSTGSPRTWDIHEIWFNRYDNENNLLFLLECDGVVMGEVHYDRGESGGIVGANAHISLQPEVRGRGIGHWMLESTIPKAYNIQGVSFLLAIIRPLNQRSIDCFTSCGFEYHSTNVYNGCEMARYIHGGN